MKRSGHGESSVSLVSGLGFILLTLVLIWAPEIITVKEGLGAMAFFLGMKSIGIVILDSHNKIHYHSKKHK